MDLQSVMHDRRVWVVGGLGAAAGVFVLIRRRRSSSTSSQNASADAPTYSAVTGAGSIDTTGTDVANWLGNYSQSLQAQYDEFTGNVLDQISKLPGEQPATTPPASPDPRTRIPVSFTAPTNSNLYNWAHQVETQTGIKDVFSLIPRASMKWGSPSKFGADPQYGNVPYFTEPVSVRVM